MPTDSPTYEAFLPHHTPSKHRVMAVIVSSTHTELRAVATVPDAHTAAQLADALNSRLLARPNHTERLDAAMKGLPDSVRAAIQQLPIDPNKADIGRTPMAARIYTDPIDGLLLFPSKGCPPDGCPECTDCDNDCNTCPICADDSPQRCEHCTSPDLTPRTAHALTVAGSTLADQCFDNVTEGWEDRDLLPLPTCMTKQNDDFIRRMARCFDDLTDDLLDGIPPRLTNLAEQLALHLMITDAEALHSDERELLDEMAALLPTSRHDYNFDILFGALFEDDDHIGFLHHTDEPDAPGTLEFLFEPFYAGEDRDPDRGFRR